MRSYFFLPFGFAVFFAGFFAAFLVAMEKTPGLMVNG
jgi:hypothetical protein